MEKMIIHTDEAPAAVGPYSQAVRIGQMVYTAGQIALNPATGELVTADEMTTAVQTEQVFKNLQAVLAAAGSSLDNVVKTTVFLRYMRDFAEMNAVYGRFFPTNPPARSTFSVTGLPLGARVEIELVAYVASSDEAASEAAPATEKAEPAKSKKEKKEKKEKKDKKKSKKKS